MALFVDGPACTIDDLTNQDAGLLEVARDTASMCPPSCGWRRRDRDGPRSGSSSRVAALSGGMPWAPALRIEQIVATRR